MPPHAKRIMIKFVQPQVKKFITYSGVEVSSNKPVEFLVVVLCFSSYQLTAADTKQFERARTLF